MSRIPTGLGLISENETSSISFCLLNDFQRDSIYNRFGYGVPSLLERCALGDAINLRTDSICCEAFTPGQRPCVLRERICDLDVAVDSFVRRSRLGDYDRAWLEASRRGPSALYSLNFRCSSGFPVGSLGRFTCPITAVISIGRRNTQVDPTFIENKS
jgi:hypothetical protein